MTNPMDKALAAISRWPASRQDEAAQFPLALDRLGSGSYRASAEELAAVDEALEQVRRGDFATAAEVEAAFARFRR
jgi:hypothetical protein